MTLCWISSSDPSQGGRRMSPRRWRRPLPLCPQKEGNPSYHICSLQSQTPRSTSFFLIPCLTRKIFLRLPPLRLSVKRQGISPCTGEPNLALPRRLAQIRGDSSAHPTPGVVTIRLLGPHPIAPRLHLLLQGASSRRRNPPIPPGNVGVFGSRSLSPRPA